MKETEKLDKLVFPERYLEGEEEEEEEEGREEGGEEEARACEAFLCLSASGLISEMIKSMCPSRTISHIVASGWRAGV